MITQLIMTIIKPKNQVLNKVVLISFLTFYLSCNFPKGLLNTWEVDDINISYNEEFKHLVNATPEVFENKLLDNFPKRLLIGDRVVFKNKSIVQVNDADIFYFNISSSKKNIIYLRNDDIMYPITYILVDDNLILSREISQGKVEWIFVKD